jgi:hypothetical protein
MSDLNVGNLLTLNATATTINGAFRLRAMGDVDLYAEGISGTATLALVSASAQVLRVHSAAPRVPKFNISSNGNVTLSADATGNGLYLTSDFTYSSGTITAQLPIYFVQSTDSAVNLQTGVNLGEVHFSMTGGTMSLTGELSASSLYCGMTGGANISGGQLSIYGNVVGNGDCVGSPNVSLASASFSAGQFFTGNTSITAGATVSLQTPMNLGQGTLTVYGTLNTVSSANSVNASSLTVSADGVVNANSASLPTRVGSSGTINL